MNDSRHCRTCGDTFEACACPSVVMTIADADAVNTEIDTLRSRLASLEAERDALREALEAAIGDLDLQAAIYRAQAKIADHAANTNAAAELDSHVRIYRRALDPTR